MTPEATFTAFDEVVLRVLQGKYIELRAPTEEDALDHMQALRAALGDEVKFVHVGRDFDVYPRNYPVSVRCTP